MFIGKFLPACNFNKTETQAYEFSCEFFKILRTYRKFVKSYFWNKICIGCLSFLKNIYTWTTNLIEILETFGLSELDVPVKSDVYVYRFLVGINFRSTKKKKNSLRFILEKRILVQDDSHACAATTKLFSLKDDVNIVN